MISLTIKQVLMMHKMLLEATGGMDGVRDKGMLESAIFTPFSTFGGNDLYPSVEEKAARLGFGIVSNHPFIDGNKRTGLLVMLAFLELNGIYIEYTDDELVSLGLGLASREMKYEELLEWVKRHLC